MKKRISILKPSTKAFFEEAARIPGYSLFERLHGYVYGRWTYLYIGIGKGDHPLAKGITPLWNAISRLWSKADPDDPDRVSFADNYHGKVVPTEAARQLVTIREEIRIDDLEKIIPYAKARSIVMKNPDHIIVLECPCRSTKENPCLPLDVCLIVGEPFASFAIEHHPGRARWINSEEAVEILEAERERGHVSHAFFKDAMLGRFYAICNCCECCCGAMNAHHNGTPMLASSGYVARVDEDLCIGCGDCEAVCQFGALLVEDGIGRVNAAACMGCGVCEYHCPEKAISLKRDPARGIPLEVQELIKERSYSAQEW